MRRSSVLVICLAASLAGGIACDRSSPRSREIGAEGTAGTTTGAASKSGGTVLTGCLEQNLDSGQFELVLEGDAARRAGDRNAGLQPGHSRLELIKQGDVELNQHVGKRVTLEGTLGAGQPVSDAGTRSYGAGAGADSSQTRSRKGGSRRMTVFAVRSVGDTCAAEKR